MVCKTWPSFNPHTNLVAVISVPANYLGQRLLRVYIICIMKFHNSSHELGMIRKCNNTQGNKMTFYKSLNSWTKLYMINYRIIEF